jgi:hypothetical protein
MKPPHELEPNFPRIDTLHQQVFDRLVTLRAQRTWVIVAQAVLLQPLRGPTATKEN